MSSCEDQCRLSLLGVTLIDHWGDFSCCYGVTLVTAWVTLIGFLVSYNQCKTFWNTFKVQNLDHLVISLQSVFKSVLLLCKCKLGFKFVVIPKIKMSALLQNWMKVKKPHANIMYRKKKFLEESWPIKVTPPIKVTLFDSTRCL